MKSSSKIVQILLWVFVSSMLSAILQIARAQQSAIQINNFPFLQDIAISQDSSVWLLGFESVLHLTTEGSLIEQFRFKGDLPSNIALAPDGSIWIAKHNLLQHYTADGTFISQFENINHNDVKIAVDGSIWILDKANNQIQHFKTDGSLIMQFGSQGSETGEFNQPNNIALANDGSIWVSDGTEFVSDAPWGGFEVTRNHRLQHFSAEGQFIAQFGVKGSGKTQFDDINDIAIAADDSLWVADGGNNKFFKHFTAEGVFIEEIKSTGLGSGSASAETIALSPGGNLWTGSLTSQGGIFLRNLKANGRIISQFRRPPSCDTEYDDLEKVVYLWDVNVDNQFYDAALKFQNGYYNLVSFTVATTAHCQNSDFTRMPSFHKSILSIPRVDIIDKPYHAKLLYVGNYSFVLESASSEW